MKIQIIENQDNIFIPDRDSLIAWIEAQQFERIHNFIPSSSMMLGADHDSVGVIDDVRSADRLALTIGSARRNNMGHALSIIKNNKLQLYDIGELTEDDFAQTRREQK